MAVQRKSLGRGLDALLDPYGGDAEAEQDFHVMEEGEISGRVLSVPIWSIDTNAAQPRKLFDEDALNELADSIRVHGIVQPLIVKEKNGRYMIIAGERRFRAARIAGLIEVPVILADYAEDKITEVSLIENIQRENLNPVEEAEAIQCLMQQYGMTQEEVSKRLGKKRSTVANTLRLLNLPPDILELLCDGRLSAGHGRVLAGISDVNVIRKLAEETLRLGYSVRALEDRAKDFNSDKPKNKEKEPLPISAALVAFEDAIRESIGTKVKVRGTEKNGKITIEYYSPEDLQRIYEQLCSQ